MKKEESASAKASTFDKPTADKSADKKEIKYGPAVIECACGNKFETGSTVPYIKVEICSACHPFYTGKQKLVDTAGRVDRFKEKMAKAQIAKAKGKKVTENKNVAEVTEEEKTEDANQ